MSSLRVSVFTHGPFGQINGGLEYAVWYSPEFPVPALGRGWGDGHRRRSEFGCYLQDFTERMVQAADRRALNEPDDCPAVACCRCPVCPLPPPSKPAAAADGSDLSAPGLGPAHSQGVDEASLPQEGEEGGAGVLLPSATAAVQVLLHAVTHADCTEADEFGWKAVSHVPPASRLGTHAVLSSVTSTIDDWDLPD